MKKFKTLPKLAAILCVLCALLLPVLPARAQFNQFSEATEVVLLAPTNAVNAATGILTNQWVDTHGMLGIAQIDIFSCTNAGGMTLTLGFETSADQTNITSGLGSYASATATSVILTNLYYGLASSVTATNTTLLPGTIVTPNASLAGFATSYLLTAPMTNTGTINIANKGIYRIGYNVQDAPRYIRTIVTPGGSATNYSVGAVLRARRFAQQ